MGSNAEPYENDTKMHFPFLNSFKHKCHILVDCEHGYNTLSNGNFCSNVQIATIWFKSAECKRVLLLGFQAS